MPRINIDLSNEDKENNKAFLKALHEVDLDGSRRWFDKLKSSFRREPDDVMTLDDFLELMDIRDSHVTLQSDKPVWDAIRYCVDLRDGDKGTRFAWVQCPLSTENYAKISEIFEETYGRSMPQYEETL